MAGQGQISAIPALKRLKWKDLEFQASLGYTKPISKNQKGVSVFKAKSELRLLIFILHLVP
jgi:hypothetical protein